MAKKKKKKRYVGKIGMFTCVTGMPLNWDNVIIAYCGVLLLEGRISMFKTLNWVLSWERAFEMRKWCSLGGSLALANSLGPERCCFALIYRDTYDSCSLAIELSFFLFLCFSIFGLKQWKFIVKQFRRLEFQNQGVRWTRLPLKPVGESYFAS